MPANRQLMLSRRNIARDHCCRTLSPPVTPNSPRNTHRTCPAEIRTVKYGLSTNCGQTFIARSSLPPTCVFHLSWMPTKLSSAVTGRLSSRPTTVVRRLCHTLPGRGDNFHLMDNTESGSTGRTQWMRASFVIRSCARPWFSKRRGLAKFHPNRPRSRG